MNGQKKVRKLARKTVDFSRKTPVFFRKVHRFFLVVEAVLFQREKNREKAEQGSRKTVERL